MAIAVAALLVGAFGMNEPLWLDELHTSWCISGAPDDVARRAIAGNQSVAFMWLQRGACWTLGLIWVIPTPGDYPQIPHAEWWIRLPSLLAFGSVAALCWTILRAIEKHFATERRSTWRANAFLFALVAGWIVWDRTQLFYATEARVYALLQFLTLLGWFAVLRIAMLPRKEVDGGKSVGNTELGLLAGWLVVSVLAIHLHLISALAVGWQAVVLLFLAQQGRFKFRVWCIAVLSLAAAVVPALALGIPVWERRSQWQSFAGNASWENVASMFPFAVFLVPTSAAWLIDVAVWRYVRWYSAVEEHEASKLSTASDIYIWFIALAGPLGTAWCTTALGVAPVMHQRYLLCCSLPLALFSACLLLRVQIAWLRWSVLLVVFGWLVVSQGSYTLWRNGQVVGWQRGEDWRRISNWIHENANAEDKVWCASGLIEGENLNPPFDEATNEYLSFPLRGIYQARDKKGGLLEPQALATDAGYWVRQWAQTQAESHFLACRAPSPVLAQVLEALKPLAAQQGKKIEVTEKARPCGSLSVAKVRLSDL